MSSAKETEVIPRPEQQHPKVFVSHSGLDKARFVLRFAEKLRRGGPALRVALLGTGRVVHRAGSTIVPSSAVPRGPRPFEWRGGRALRVALHGTGRVVHVARSTTVPSSAGQKTCQEPFNDW